VNYVDCDGNSPLHIAVQRERLDIVQALCEVKEVWFDILNEERKTALMVAEEMRMEIKSKDRKRVFKFLRKRSQKKRSFFRKMVSHPYDPLPEHELDL